MPLRYMKDFLVIILFLLIDLGCVSYAGWQFRSPQSVRSEGRAVAELILQDDDIYRVYSPSYSIPQLAAADAGLQLADGVDPLQLKQYAEFMSTASGVPQTGYSVTIPPFTSGNPRLDNQDYSPDSYLLGLLNVKYIVAEYELVSDSLKLVDRIENTRIYRNQEYRPRAWTQQGLSLFSAGIQPVDIVWQNANRIELTAAGPGTLVLSEIEFPGWKVKVDGQWGEILTIGNLLRGVNLPPGIHTVSFIYRPTLMYVGMFLSGLLLVVFFASLLMRKKQV